MRYEVLLASVRAFEWGRYLGTGYIPSPVPRVHESWKEKQRQREDQCGVEQSRVEQSTGVTGNWGWGLGMYMLRSTTALQAEMA